MGDPSLAKMKVADHLEAADESPLEGLILQKLLSTQPLGPLQDEVHFRQNVNENRSAPGPARPTALHSSSGVSDDSI